MMRGALSEEQEAYRDALRDWLSSVAPLERVHQWFDDDDRLSFESLLLGADWSGVGVAEDLGGQGGGLVELALGAEEFGRAAVPTAGWLASVLAAPVVGLEQEGPTAWAFTADGIPCVPDVRVDAEARLQGEVPWVLAGDRAQRFLVAADGPEGRGLFLVDRDQDGVQVNPHRLLDRSRSVADVRFSAARGVPVEGDADELIAQAADRAAVLVAADALGAMQRMLDLAVEYSGQRHQFGVPIGSFQAVKHAAATILVGVESARSVVYFAAASADGEDADRAKQAAAVKAQVTAEAVAAADSALTLHGAIGYTWEHDLHLFYKRARLDGALFGEPAQWNDRLADLLPLLETP